MAHRSAVAAADDASSVSVAHGTTDGCAERAPLAGAHALALRSSVTGADGPADDAASLACPIGGPIGCPICSPDGPANRSAHATALARPVDRALARPDGIPFAEPFRTPHTTPVDASALAPRRGGGAHGLDQSAADRPDGSGL